MILRLLNCLQELLKIFSISLIFYCEKVNDSCDCPSQPLANIVLFELPFKVFKTRLVSSHIGWRGERNITYEGVETSPYQTRFKTLREGLERKTQREQYMLELDLSYYKWY